MTQTQTKSIVALAFALALFSIFLVVPQTSEAASLRDGDMAQLMNKARAMASSTKATSTRPVVDLSCVQDAVLTRETAVTEAWTDFNLSVTAALTKRTDALVAAWQITDAKTRATALKALWKNWKDESKKAHSTLKSERKAAWAEHKQTMKTECKETRLPKEDAEPKDASGAVTI